MASSESVVGSILGYLRLDTDQFHRELDKAVAGVEYLQHQDATVKVKADTAGADAKLAATGAATDKLDRSTAHLGQTQQATGGRTRALLTAIAILGPALIPVAAGATGLAVAFGAMGTAGILAIVGIRKEMADGTSVGRSYTGLIGVLKGDLDTLGKTAAAGVLGPFSESVADLQSRMPALNRMVGEFSTITGRTAGVFTSGLIAAFIAFEPLARQAGVYMFTLGQRFAALMSGTGVVSFGDYIRSVFPQVMADLEAVVGAVVHLVAALAPLGLGVLGILRAFSDLISAIPVDVLTAVAVTAGGVFLAFKTYDTLTGPLARLSAGVQKLGVSAQTAATGVRVLKIAAGAIGAVLAIATFLYSRHAESVRQDQDAVNSLTDALIRNNGVIDDNTVKEQASKLAKDGTLKAAKDLGYAVGDVLAASLGNNADATARVNAHTKELNDTWAKQAQAAGIVSGSLADVDAGAKKVTDATKDGTKNFGIATDAYNAWTTATATGATATSAAGDAQARLAAGLGAALPTMQAATTAQQQTATSTASAIVQMQLENNAAGILKGTLDLLNGEALSAADAQNAFDSSLTNMGTHVTSTGKAIHFTTTSIGNMSAASVALRGQLNGQVANLQRVVEANGGLSDSTGKARAQMKTMRQQIIDNAVAHGVDRKAVTDYIDGLLKIPKKVPPTKLDVEKKEAQRKVTELKGAIDSIPKARAAYIAERGAVPARARIMELQDAIDRLKGKTVTVTTRLVTGRYAGKQIPIGSADGNIFKAYASGGFENHTAQIAPAGAMRLWAEPETGGEAYIPLAPAKRARSTEILAETNRLMGDPLRGGTVTLDDVSVAKLAAAMSRVQVKSTISAGSVDRALVGGMR